jgi:membrane-bound lytic murein transglycosylase B
MIKKCLIVLLSLFFTFSLCEAAQIRKASRTYKRYVPPLQSNLSKNKPKLIKLFNDAGIENAEDLFSDPRLKLHYEFWTGGGTPGDYPAIMTPESISRGRQKILENYEFLESVEAKYGVPKEILISIFRVETNLGRYMGNYSVFNSLLTWAISGTRKWKWAQQELITFVIICRQFSLDPFNIPGSTHGAFGLLQFIPTSFVRFAIPWKGESADLFNFEDAIASSANYLQQCGWDPRNRNKQRRSIYAYNASTPYVNTIFRYASAIKISSYDAMRFVQAKIKVKEQMIQIIEGRNEDNIEDTTVQIKEEEIKIEEPMIEIKGDDNKIERNI